MTATLTPEKLLLLFFVFSFAFIILSTLEILMIVLIYKLLTNQSISISPEVFYEKPKKEKEEKPFEEIIDFPTMFQAEKQKKTEGTDVDNLG